MNDFHDSNDSFITSVFIFMARIAKTLNIGFLLLVKYFEISMSSLLIGSTSTAEFPFGP